MNINIKHHLINLVVGFVSFALVGGVAAGLGLNQVIIGFAVISMAVGFWFYGLVVRKGYNYVSGSGGEEEEPEDDGEPAEISL